MKKTIKNYKKDKTKIIFLLNMKTKSEKYLVKFSINNFYL